MVFNSRYEENRDTENQSDSFRYPVLGLEPDISL